MSSFNPVKPGDIITAAFINQVIKSFDNRISALETASGVGGKMVITALSPAAPLHMGDQLTVIGQNFGLPSQAVVTVDGVRVDGSGFLPGSGNNALIFLIPAVQGVPPEGKLVTLIVSNPTSAATVQFTLFPFALTIPTGQLFVNMTGAPSVGSITSGNSYVFVFTATASTSLTDVYKLAASLDAASTAAGWSVATVDSSGNPLSQVSIKQGQNTTTTVGVKVTIPAAAAVASSAQVTLTVTSSTNPTGLIGSGLTTVTVGSAPPPPNTISVAIVGVSATGLAGASNSGNNSITLPRGTTSAVVAVSLLVPDTASSVQYTCSGPTFVGSGWAGSVSALDSPFFGQSTPVLVHVNITSVPSGPANATMTFKVQENGKPSVFGQITPSINVL